MYYYSLYRRGIADSRCKLSTNGWKNNILDLINQLLLTAAEKSNRWLYVYNWMNVILGKINCVYVEIRVTISNRFAVLCRLCRCKVARWAYAVTPRHSNVRLHRSIPATSIIQPWYIRIRLSRRRTHTHTNVRSTSSILLHLEYSRIWFASTWISIIRMTSVNTDLNCV